MSFVQHGDLLLFKSELAPEINHTANKGVIHAGDNHSHNIEGLHSFDGKYLICKEECLLTHDEHKTITLAPGVYEKRIVLEYDHFLEESRQVID